MTEKDINEFIDQLTGKQFEKITDFFTEGPSVVYNNKHTCMSCTKEFGVELKGMDNFF